MLPHYVHETIVHALKYRMCAEDKTAPIIDSVHNNGTRSRKLLQIYLETGNYLLEKYATDQATTEYDAAIFLYIYNQLS